MNCTKRGCPYCQSLLYICILFCPFPFYDCPYYSVSTRGHLPHDVQVVLRSCLMPDDRTENNSNKSSHYTTLDSAYPQPCSRD